MKKRGMSFVGAIAVCAIALIVKKVLKPTIKEEKALMKAVDVPGV